MLLLLLYWAAPAYAGPPFACDGSIYQVQSGQLRIFDPVTSSYINVGPANSSYNATGYNTLDNYAYASQGNWLIRISSDGTIERVHNLGFGSFSGDVDFSNNYWLRRNNNRYARIDIATGSVVNINFTGLGGGAAPSGGPADVAYDINGGDEYLIGFTGGGRLYRYNITTAEKERIDVSGLPGGGYGATWTDSTGRLLTFNNNSGVLYEVSDYYTNSPTFTQVGVGVPSGNNDGFSCSLAAFPNLPPLAFDDDYTTPVNVAISDNVITNNDNGIDNDPEGQAILVTTLPVSGPSNGTVSLSANGDFTYTPNPNFFGFDVFEYEITDPSGLTATATVTIEIIADPNYTVVKTQSGGPATVTAVGDTIQYDIEILNTGDVPLTSVVATDTLPDGTIVTLTGQTESGAASNTPGQLDLGETWLYTTSYSADQDDIDAGGNLVNNVSVTTDETGVTTKSDSASTPITQSPSFTLDKSVNVANIAAPNLLTYTITVDNTGNQTLTGVSITDTLVQNGAGLTLTSGPTLSGDSDGDDDLDSDEIWVYTATFDATQDQIDDGSDILNTAVIDTDQTAAQNNSATTTITQNPSFDVAKTASLASISAPGVISYSIAVTNTGNTSVTGLVPSDVLTQGATTLSLTTGLDLSGDADGDSVLDLGETWLYSGTYSVGQAQINDGTSIVNDISIASANAGTEVSQATTTITGSPSFTISKSVDTANLTAPGTLTYAIVVENTGNVDLTATSLVDDLVQGGALALTSGPTLSGDADGDSELDVGEVWTYAASFDVLQSHIDNGSDIVNTATFDASEVAAQNNNATTTITQTDAIGLAKSVAAGEPTSFSADGDTIDFTFVVTNNGNTTLLGPITIDDDEIGNGLVCSAGNILPGASVSCDHTWTATQADVNAGSVTNTATAEDDSGNVSAAEQATVSAVQSPALSIDKQIVAPIPGTFAAGQVLNYEYTVVNIGNVTLSGPITLTDNLTPNSIDTAAISCDPVPGGGLLPQGSNPVGPTNSIVCTAQYTLTGNDELLGSTTNIASAEMSFGANPVVSPIASAVFPVGAAPVLDLQKSAPGGLTVSEITDTITYTYRIESIPPLSGTGAVLPGVIFINDDKFAAPITCYDPAVDGGSFSPGDVHTCTAIYTVTQADLDAGEVVNEATANTIFAPGSPSPIDVVSNIATETVPVDETPGLTVVKTVTGGPNPAAVGNTITYQIVATNTGNQSLSNVGISDPQLGGLSCDLAAPVSLLRGAALTCTGSYDVTQADVDGQTVGNASTAEFTNTATAVANDPAGAAIPEAQGSVDHPLVAAAPSIAVTKTLFPDPAADPAYTAVNDVVQYRIAVTNDGNMTLSSVDVTDSLAAGTCTVGPLAPGETNATCLFSVVVDQDDIDAGEITNIGSASAQPIDGAASPVTDIDTLDSPGPSFASALEVGKAGSLDLGANGIADEGDIINYSITIRNTGNVTVSDIAVTDAAATSISYPSGDFDNDNDIDRLEPNDFVTVTATRVLTQSDVNAGQFTNTATATGEDPVGASVSDVSDSANAADGAGADDPTVTPIPRTSGMTIDKSFSALDGMGEGDTITYSYMVVNTGNVTLTNITLNDQHTSAAGTAALTIANGGVIASLAPGLSAVLTASYIISQDDVDAGNALTNIVTANATVPAGVTAPVATDNASVSVESADPELEVIKSVRSQTGSAAGDTVVFEILIENTGNVSLSNVALTDTLARVDNVVITPAPTPVFESGDAGTASVIDVGETWTYTATYALTQDDIDAGGIRNSVLVETNAPDGADVTDVSDNGSGSGSSPTVLAIVAAPSLETVKTITSATTGVGETVTFEITVRNTGNVTLSSVQIASDTLTRANGDVLTIGAPAFGSADMGSVAGTLQVGEIATYTASYDLVQEDIDAGGIENTATAQGTPPFGSPVSDVSDDTGAGGDPTVLTIAAALLIEFDKRLSAGGPSFDTVGDTLSFEFEITNIGNVTLSAPYNVADPMITDAGGVISCPATDIAPMASVICTGSYDVDQDDLDAGQVENMATATVGAAAAVSDMEIIPAQQSPAIVMVKTSENVEAADFVVGAVVTYTFTTTNTGNVTLTSPVTIDDSLIDSGDITCDPFPAAGIAPGNDYVCTGDYTVTSEDVEVASVTNNASASDGANNSPISSVTIPNSGMPALGVDKELISSLQPDNSPNATLTFDEIGDQLVYRFTITNSGTVSFARDVEITDTNFASPIACFVPTLANPDLTAGETAVCTATYVVDQDDLDAGEVINEAFAQTDYGAIPTVVISPPDMVTTLADADPMATIMKTADRTDFTALNEIVTFDFVVTNTGNQTLNNVEVTDPLIPGLSCEVASLPVSGILICSDTYTITQADIDRGSLMNTARVAAMDPQGDPILEATADVTINGPSVAPSLDIQKTANPDPYGAVGTGLTFTFDVTNTSIYTMSDIVVTDPLPDNTVPFTCTVGTLAPGASDNSCQLVTSVTQDMVDAGSITNLASVAGEDPFANSATDSDTITVNGPAEAPAILATKTASVPATTLGSVVAFTVQIENPGNVSLDFILLDDVMTRNDGTPLTLDSGFSRVSGDTNFDGELNPTEIWIYEAPYTIVQDDINEGGFSNSVVARGMSPSGTEVTDTSDDGDDSDGNTVDDPTVVAITTDPILDVEKLISTTGGAVGDVVVFEIRASNVGNVDIFNTDVVDVLTRADGTDISSLIVGPTNTTAAADLVGGEMSPGETWTWDVSYTLQQEDLDAGGISNTATATGQDSGGNDVTDVSDNGDDADGNVADDPTVLTFPPMPGLDVVKTLVSIGSAAGEDAVFQVAFTNTGNVTLSAPTLDDTLSNLDGDLVGPITSNVSGLTSNTIPVGDTANFTVVYELTQADVDAGGLSNTATVTAMTPGGQMLNDVSDDGDDSDGNTVDDPTLAPIASNPAVLVWKSATVPNRVAPDLYDVTFSVGMTNTGNVTLTDLVVEDPLTAFAAPAEVTSVSDISSTGFINGSENAGYDGDSDVNLLTAGTGLSPGVQGVIMFTVRYSTVNGQPAGTNTAYVSSAEITAAVLADVTVASSGEPDIFASKSVSPATAVLGDTVTYTLTFQNRLGTQESNLEIIDILPDGILFTPGTAQIDGTDNEPQTVGNNLQWSPVSIGPNETVTVRFEARVVSGASGEYINSTYAADSEGNRVSNVATATLTRRPEAVFDCADIIGKVFDDRNGNGYQDGYDVDRSAITVQEFFSDKFAEPEETTAELGLPDVRLSTVNGTLITTDEHGRYSVPCAELPAEIGSNFQLKLDVRTLPTGYNVTTENPRNVRVTPGRMTRLNFGAALSNLVEIDLTAAAFASGQPNAALTAWLDNLIDELNKSPSILRITYHRGVEAADVANANLDALERAVRQKWQDRTSRRLVIERLIRRVQ